MLLEPLDAPQTNVCNAVCNRDADLRARISEAVLAGDDVEAVRLMALLFRPKLRAVR